jgi:hypothetical protein
MPASARRVVARYLSAAPVRLNPATMAMVNAALVKAGMDGNSPFRKTTSAVERASEILSSYYNLGLSGLNTANLRGAEGEAPVRVVMYNSEGMSQMTTNELIFQWVSAEDGTVMVVAYLT